MQNINNLLIDDDMRFQADRDITKRSFTGTYVYLLIWLAIIIPNGFYRTSPEICFWITAAFVVLAASRVGLIAYFRKIYPSNPLTWKCIFYPVIWAASLTWGILCAAAFIHPAFEKLTLVIVISTAGLVGAGSESFIPSRPLMLVLLTTYLAPSVLTLAVTDVQNHSVTAVFIIYWFGVYGVTRIQHREYWLGLNNSFIIRKHAAELEKLNTLDGLTGLKNRVYFDTARSRELKRAKRAQTRLTLLFIDIDHFKKVNDRFGHLVGDECLRRLSKLLGEHFKRETDTVARYGGEEFAVIIPDNDREEAVCMAEKIRRAVETMDPKYGESEVPLTISIGVSSKCPRPDDTETSMIQQADMNLYRAKHNGRNQVWG